jgi:long-chain acyl-CoA synthetase
MLVTFGWIGALKKLLTPEPTRSVPVNEDGSKPWHRVHAKFRNNLMSTPYDDVLTLYHLAKRSCALHPTTKCMGSRKFLKQLSPKVKQFDEGIVWRTYAEVEKTYLAFGASLKASGCVAAPEAASLEQLTTPCSLAIFENTCPEWMLAALGAFSQGMIVTTIYATLGMDAVVSAVNDGKISAILCNARSVQKLQERLHEMPTLKTLVYTSDLVGPEETIDVSAKSDKATVVSFEDFCDGADTAKHPPTPPSPKSTAVIMYTSGSTGKPKGVVITHENVLGMVGSVMYMFEVVPGEETYLGYLPLAHILELTAEFSMIATGSTICYADPKTLSATGASPVGALELYKPTTMAGVPKIWDVIAKGVKAKISKTSPFSQFLVETAFSARSFAIAHGYDTPLFKALVFKKFGVAVGGRMTRALSGGGPLNKEVQVFCRTAFGMPLFQGYVS